MNKENLHTSSNIFGNLSKTNISFPLKENIDIEGQGAQFADAHGADAEDEALVAFCEECGGLDEWVPLWDHRSLAEKRTKEGKNERKNEGTSGTRLKKTHQKHSLLNGLVDFS